MNVTKNPFGKTHSLYKPKDENVKKLEAFLKNIEEASDNKKPQ